MNMEEDIPVVLFAYARPDHLRRTLDSLRADNVPFLYVYCDGPRSNSDRTQTDAVRRMVREIDWVRVHCIERVENLGLGRSIRAGVSEVLAKHHACIVLEDDLVVVPGTYAWMCSALRHYAADARVMSVTAWTHPRVTPADVSTMPYFDGRAECWVWGTWPRAWSGMEDGDAIAKFAEAHRRGVSPDRYGFDLAEQAHQEHKRNVWAVRWLLHHMVRGGLCLRPPRSMVEHIGFDAAATNAANAGDWMNPPLLPAAVIPSRWPEPIEHPQVAALWQAATRLPRSPTNVRSWIKRVIPAGVRERLRACAGWQWFRGTYSNWEAASRAATGYSSEAIVARVLDATQEVVAGRAAFERDGVLFPTPDVDRPLLDALAHVRTRTQGGLKVLDFGGSLGSTYWRHRAWLAAIANSPWHIVEQPLFVEAGRRHLGSAPLRFFHSVDEACESNHYDVLLASGVLQYLPDPDGVIDDWLRHGFPWLLINNLPLHDRADRITVQYVPPSIYPASYPVRFFNRSNFLNRFEGRYSVVREFASEAVWPTRWHRFASTGLLLSRIH